MQKFNVGDRVLYKNGTFTVITVGYNNQRGYIYNLQSYNVIPDYPEYNIPEYDLRSLTATAALSAAQSATTAVTYKPLPKFMVGDKVLYADSDEIYIIDKYDPNGFFSYKIISSTNSNRSYWVQPSTLRSAAGVPDSTPAGCQHEYKTYTGLFESYEYCSKCEQKKDDIVALVAKSMVDNNSVQLQGNPGAFVQGTIQQVKSWTREFFGSNEEQ